MQLNMDFKAHQHLQGRQMCALGLGAFLCFSMVACATASDASALEGIMNSIKCLKAKPTLFLISGELEPPDTCLSSDLIAAFYHAAVLLALAGNPHEQVCCKVIRSRISVRILLLLHAAVATITPGIGGSQMSATHNGSAVCPELVNRTVVWYADKWFLNRSLPCWSHLMSLTFDPATRT